MTVYESLPAAGTITILGTEYKIQAIDATSVDLDTDYTDGTRQRKVTYRGHQYVLHGRFTRGESGWTTEDDYLSPNIGLVGGEYSWETKRCSPKSRAAIEAEASKAIAQWVMENPDALAIAHIVQANNRLYMANRKLADAQEAVAQAAVEQAEKQGIHDALVQSFEDSKAVQVNA